MNAESLFLRKRRTEFDLPSFTSRFDYPYSDRFLKFAREELRLFCVEGSTSTRRGGFDEGCQLFRVFSRPREEAVSVKIYLAKLYRQSIESDPGTAFSVAKINLANDPNLGETEHRSVSCTTYKGSNRQSSNDKCTNRNGIPQSLVRLVLY